MEAIGTDSLTIEENKVDAYNEYQREMDSKDLSIVSLNTFANSHSNNTFSTQQHPNYFPTNPQRKNQCMYILISFNKFFKIFSNI